MIDYVSAIHQRISRRSYLPAPIEEEKLAVLKQEIEKANQESGLSITFLEDGSEAFEGVKSYGMFSGVRSLIVLKGFEETEHLREKAGYYGERLVLAATALGLGTCWVGYFPENPVRNLLGIPREVKVVAITPLGVPDEAPSARPRVPLGKIVFEGAWRRDNA